MDIQLLQRQLYAPWRFQRGGRNDPGWVEANNRHHICEQVCPWAGAVVDMAPAFLMSLVRIAEISPPGERAGEIARRAIKEYEARNTRNLRR